MTNNQAHQLDNAPPNENNQDVKMANPFFEHPILNSPYDCPARHWELDEQGQPTQQIIETRRRAEFITPIPKPKKRKKAGSQEGFVFDEGKGLSTKEQQYDPTSIINGVRDQVDIWRAWPKPSSGRLLPRRHGCFSIGELTSSPASARFSARLKRSKQRSG